MHFSGVLLICEEQEHSGFDFSKAQKKRPLCIMDRESEAEKGKAFEKDTSCG